jgi:hypothetical protein
MDALNPVDVVVLSGLLATEARDAWTQLALAEAMTLSPATTFRSIHRLAGARLWDADTRRVHRGGAQELLIHAVRWVFPADVGAVARGVPTAHAGPPLRDLFASDSPYVWPWEGGDATGPSVRPLHSCAASLPVRLPAAYELLTLVDALRVGRARERQAAATAIAARLRPP